jgi:GNAT superfamily N-acetyltransferase
LCSPDHLGIASRRRSRSCTVLAPPLPIHPDARSVVPLRNALLATPHSIAIPCDLPTSIALRLAGRDIPGNTFPLPPLDFLQLAQDKLRTSQWLRRHGIECPETHSMDSVVPSELAYPVILKPRGGEGSCGVTLCLCARHLAKTVQESPFPPSDLLVQPYVEGHDVMLSFLAEHGAVQAWTCYRRKNAEIFGPAFGHLEFTESDAVLELAGRLCVAARYHGIGNLDLRIPADGGRPALVDLNPRIFGTVHLHAWAGVNYIDLALRLSNGESIAPRFRPLRTQICSPQAMATLLRHGRLDRQALSAPTFRALLAFASDPLPWVRWKLAMRRPPPAQSLVPVGRIPNLVYFKRRVPRSDDAPPVLPAGYEMDVWRPSPREPCPTHLPLRPYWIWAIYHFAGVFRNASLSIATARCNGMIVATACQLPAHYRYPFMAPDDACIGLAWTHPNHRRKGLSTALISALLSRSAPPSRTVWACTEEVNLPSRALFGNLRFEPVARGLFHPSSFKHPGGQFVIPDGCMGESVTTPSAGA